MMTNRSLVTTALLAVFVVSPATPTVAQSPPQAFGIESRHDIENIAPIREQILKEEEWLRWRKQHVVPEVMQRIGVDMWLVGRQDDALYYSLHPANREGLISQRVDALVFYDRGGDAGVEHLALDRAELAALVRNRDPARIGVSDDSHDQFAALLGDALAARLVVDNDLRTGFLEKRSPEEISVFQHVARVAYDVIAQAFSNRVIVPDVTTTDDLNWWIRQRYRELGVDTSDHPTITIQRSRLERPKYDEGDEHFSIAVPPRNGYNTVIRRGDIIACDTGINYYGIGTDTQQVAYVLKEGETEVPEGLRVALDNTNRVQNHFARAFAAGRPSRDIVNAALRSAQDDGLRPSIYSHPLPYYLRRYSLNGGFLHMRYGAGPELGEGELEEPAPQLEPGGYPVYANTTYAMELHAWTSVPEWGGQDVRITLEQNVAMTEDRLIFLGGRQVEWYVIR
jgi:Xaa-Pro aminopeptidase